MGNQNERKDAHIEGKVISLDGDFATLVLENGQKIFWPRDHMQGAHEPGEKVFIGMESKGEGDENMEASAQAFMNSILLS